MTDSERMGVAQWILERNLHWVSAAEVKTGVIVALDTAMLGALLSAFSALAPGDRTAWAILFTMVSASCLGVALFGTAMSVLPKMTGPDSSLIFFGKIAKRNVPDYVVAFKNATDADLLEDCLAQAQRNAEIAFEKFKWIRTSMIWSFVAVLPWGLALSTLISA